MFERRKEFKLRSTSQLKWHIYQWIRKGVNNTEKATYASEILLKFFPRGQVYSKNINVPENLLSSFMNINQAVLT